MHHECHIYHQHHVVPLARISLTLAGHSTLSSIAFGRSARLHPCSHRAAVDKFWLVVQSLLISVKGFRGARHSWVCPYFSNSVPHVFFVLFGWFKRWEGGGSIAAALWNVASRICSLQLTAFLCNCCQAFSLYALSGSLWCIHKVVDCCLEKNCVLFYRTGLTSIWPIANW